MAAARWPARRLPANNQFALLCGIPHNANYAQPRIMLSRQRQ
jgi:hypothetical protein